MWYFSPCEHDEIDEQNKFITNSLPFLQQTQGPGNEATEMFISSLVLRPREEKGSGVTSVTSPNPWASSRSVEFNY